MEKVSSFASRCPHCTSDISSHTKGNAESAGIVVALIILYFVINEYDLFGPIVVAIIFGITIFAGYKFYKFFRYLYPYIINFYYYILKRKRLKEEAKEIIRDQPKTVIKCPNCVKKIRVPRMKKLEIKCPHCNHVWIEET
jgi:Zn finger protein HypA/HybF involved in hydrogenase expression